MEIADEHRKPDGHEVGAELARALIGLARVIDARLTHTTDLTLAEYSVLIGLAEAEENAIRISNLTVWAPMSRSGLTRLVDRLALRGIVKREPAADDRRSQMVVLTDTGMKLAEASKATQHPWICRMIAQNLHGLDLATLTDAFEKIGSQAIPPRGGSPVR